MVKAAHPYGPRDGVDAARSAQNRGGMIADGCALGAHTTRFNPKTLTKPWHGMRTFGREANAGRASMRGAARRTTTALCRRPTTSRPLDRDITHGVELMEEERLKSGLTRA